MKLTHTFEGREALTALTKAVMDIHQILDNNTEETAAQVMISLYAYLIVRGDTTKIAQTVKTAVERADAAAVKFSMLK